MEECGNDRKREVIITLRPHIPIRKKPVVVEIATLRDKSLVDGICLRGDKEELAQCSITLSTKHTKDLPLTIRLRTTCGLPETPNKEVNFKLGNLLGDPSQTNLFWLHGFNSLPTIKVS